MELHAATDELIEQYSNDIPELVWSTGPVSYEYHFGDRELFDAVVLESWKAPGTLFAADATTLAVEDGELAGIVIAMAGPEFRSRGAALGSIWKKLLEAGSYTMDDVKGVVYRSDRASWMNPAIYSDTYYVHALAVKPEFRGKRVGYLLIEHAINTGREGGYKRFQLDVLSDNPAVEFYRAVGLELLAETRTPEPCAYGIPPEWRMGMDL